MYFQYITGLKFDGKSQGKTTSTRKLILPFVIQPVNYICMCTSLEICVRPASVPMHFQILLCLQCLNLKICYFYFRLLTSIFLIRKACLL